LPDTLKNLSIEEVLETLGIHWYNPSKLTRGLMQAYVQCQTLKYLFSSSKVMSNYTQKKQRTLMKIDNSIKGVSVQQLSKIFGLCQQVIRNYIHAFNEGGLDKLMPVKQTGRPPRVAHWTREDWDKIMEQTPDQYDKLNTKSRQWTFQRLALYVKEYHGVRKPVEYIE
jgi:transposase